IRFGMEKTSEPTFCIPRGSGAMRGVVGTPLFSLTMPPNCHPPTTAAKPLWRCDPGNSQVPLTETAWVTLKSEGPLLIEGANQNQLVTEFEKVSPATVAEE